MAITVGCYQQHRYQHVPASLLVLAPRQLEVPWRYLWPKNRGVFEALRWKGEVHCQHRFLRQCMLNGKMTFK